MLEMLEINNKIPKRRNITIYHGYDFCDIVFWMLIYIYACFSLYILIFPHLPSVFECYSKFLSKYLEEGYMRMPLICVKEIHACCLRQLFSSWLTIQDILKSCLETIFHTDSHFPKAKSPENSNSPWYHRDLRTHHSLQAYYLTYEPRKRLIFFIFCNMR